MKNTRFFLLLVALLVCIHYTTAQTGIELTTSISLDYFTTQSTPKLQGNGYPNQMLIRPSLGAKVNVNKRIRVGVNFEYYTRKEKYDCIYFTGPDDPPMRNSVTFINNPMYACEFRSNSKINYLDIPLVIEYDFLKTNATTFFASIGIGPQIILRRTNHFINNQTNETREERSSEVFTLSWKTSRCRVGAEKQISPKLSLIGSIEFKTDEFLFVNNTFGINTALNYNF